MKLRGNYVRDVAAPSGLMQGLNCVFVVRVGEPETHFGICSSHSDTHGSVVQPVCPCAARVPARVQPVCQHLRRWRVEKARSQPVSTWPGRNQDS